MANEAGLAKDHGVMVLSGSQMACQKQLAKKTEKEAQFRATFMAGCSP